MNNKNDMTTKNKILREVENFTDQNSAHYFQVFQKFSNGDGIFTLNIPVLFIGSFWFFYRKMVLLGSLILISTFLIFVFIIIFFKNFLWIQAPFIDGMLDHFHRYFSIDQCIQHTSSFLVPL